MIRPEYRIIYAMKAYLRKIRKELGAYLRDIRMARGVSQLNLGVKIGVDQAHISRIESGDLDMRVGTLLLLCRALSIKLFTLFREIDV